jgi:hypothetical protein
MSNAGFIKLNRGPDTDELLRDPSMSAHDQTRGAVGPSDPQNEKAARGKSGQLNESAKVAATAEEVNREAERFILRWLQSGGISYYQRLARVTRAAAQKGRQ